MSDSRHDRQQRSRRQTGRSRSRSPYRGDRKNRRSRTPTRDGDAKSQSRIRPLPLGARLLRKHDYKAFQSLFALYLDVQKQLVLEDLEEREAKGRWKSFVNKWNRGDLAEGWYDPETYVRAQASFEAATPSPQAPSNKRLRDGRQLIDSAAASPHAPTESKPREADIADADVDEDDYGPCLPTTLTTRSTTTAASATIPSLQDLALQHESSLEAQQASLTSHRLDRKSHRQLAASRLDELAPRAETGSRERQLEKKREVGAANRSFAAAKTDGGGAVEVGDEELMGGGDGAEEFRQKKADMEKRKSDRDLRREEVLRAKQAEREERMRVYRERETETMKGLVELARARFG